MKSDFGIFLNLVKSDAKNCHNIDIIIVTLVWFLFANSSIIMQIGHAKTFKMMYTRCLYNNPFQRYS